MRPLGVILLCIAFARIAGLDLALAQLDAWSSMIYDRADSGLAVAVESTFSGKAPCPKCLNLKEERKERQTQPALSLHSLEKLKLPPLQKEHALVKQEQVLTYFIPLPTCDHIQSQFCSSIEPPPPKFV